MKTSDLLDTRGYRSWRSWVRDRSFDLQIANRLEAFELVWSQTAVIWHYGIPMAGNYGDLTVIQALAPKIH